MLNNFEIQEEKFKQFLSAAKRGGGFTQITAKYNLLEQRWFLDIQYADDAYKLFLKKGVEKGFKDIDPLVNRLKKFGATELIIKL